MAESMKGLHRTCRCAELTEEYVGKTVTVMGWVAKQRNKGGIVFVDLRDRSGLIQLIYEETDCGEENFRKAEKMRAEFVVAATGKVTMRCGAVNPNLPTGTIEVRVTDTRILSESETPPFHIVENSNTKEELRLQYRSLDLRRPDMQRKLMLRSRIVQDMRTFMDKEGFLEIETPILCKSTPEGARDYLVPSRVKPGTFYALPQSPQLFKQLLMCSGYDRYFQIARCFRDEDLRADRQPEFTQADMELSFVDIDDVIDVNERLIQYVVERAIGLHVEIPFPRMKWIDAMNDYGSDKPDTRFGMKLVEVTDLVKGCGFGVFADAAEKKGWSVRGINAKGQGGMGRKQIDKIVEMARGNGAKGLPYISLKEDGSVKCSFAKFVSEEEIKALVDRMGGEPGDLLFFAADKNGIVWNVLGALRLKSGSSTSLSLSGQRKKTVLWRCIIPSPCRWKRTGTALIPIPAVSGQRPMTSFSTASSSAAAVSVYTRATSRKRCLRSSASPKRRQMRNSVSCSLLLNTAFLLMQDSPTVLTASSCFWPARTVSVRSSPSPRTKTRQTS